MARNSYFGFVAANCAADRKDDDPCDRSTFADTFADSNFSFDPCDRSTFDTFADSNFSLDPCDRSTFADTFADPHGVDSSF